MLDYTFVKEVVKRRWYVLVLVTVLFAVIGVLVSLPKDSSGPVVTRYSAEATVYYHEQDAVGTVNSSDLQGYNLADVQRVVLSDSVAGTVREAFSDDVTISSPYWKNVDTNANMNTRFIAVVATAASQDEATKAAQMAAELAVNAVNTKPSGITASIYEDAVPVPTGSSSATNFGTAALNVTPSVAVASGISWKRVVVIALLGLVVGFVVLIVGGLARRRLYTEHDVESVLGVPSLGSVSASHPSGGDMTRIAATAARRAAQSNVDKLVLCGFSDADLPENVAGELCAQVGCLSARVALLSPAADVSVLEEAQALVLMIRSGADSPTDIKRAAHALQLMDVPSIGAVMVR